MFSSYSRIRLASLAVKKNPNQIVYAAARTAVDLKASFTRDSKLANINTLANRVAKYPLLAYSGRSFSTKTLIATSQKNTDAKKHELTATAAQVHNEYYLNNLVFRVYKETSSVSRQPYVLMRVPSNEVIVGGGR